MKSRFVQIFNNCVFGDAVGTACADAADLTGANQRISRILTDGQDLRKVLHMKDQRKIFKRSDDCHIRYLRYHRTSMPGTWFHC